MNSEIFSPNRPASKDFQTKAKKTPIEVPGIRSNAIKNILTALYEKNPREEMHSNRVRYLCKKIASAMQLLEKEISEIETAALMHDIGKIAISDRILNKAGPLDEKEWQEIKRHPEIGFIILNSSDEMRFAAEYVRSHHERVDGTGYPDHLRGQDIPFVSRILAVADSYDAMTAERPYRKPLKKEEALAELQKNAGTQFDPDVVRIFRSCLP